MNVIGQQIVILRNRFGYTQEDLADIIGVSKQTISNWETGLKNPRMGSIQKMADHFNVSKSFIIDGIGDSDITIIYNQLQSYRKQKVYNFAENQLKEQTRKQTVKIYGQTAAGEPLSYGDNIVEEREVTYIPAGAEYALAIKGDSMEPLLKNGSVVFYKKQASVENGEIAIVEINGDGVTCKRVKYDYENQKVILQSLNQKYEDMIFANKHIRILGKVIK